jgi:dipeptidyl aminopeptidase/acylaminoacyl peptidase
MVSNISYIDDTRVAVWGWSYGGYLAAQLLAEDDRRLISCAVSVAPVVKWQLYGKFISSFLGLTLIEMSSENKKNSHL